MVTKMTLSPAELIEMINSGGWELHGSYRVLPAASSGKMARVVEVREGKIHIEDSDGQEIDLPFVSVMFPEPWQVEVCHEYLHRQQRKKVDGGGWHEVPRIGVAIEFRNPEIEKTVREQRAKAEERNERRRELLEKRATATRRQGLSKKLNAEYAGKRIAESGIRVTGGNLSITFDDGAVMRIELDGGDLYDACLMVNSESCD